MLDGTRLFVGDALTAPGTAIWIGWLGSKDLADLPLRGKAEEVVRICVSQALTLEDDDIDWDLLQRTPRWAINKPTHLLIAVALVTTIRNRITGYKPSATEICQILGVLTMYTDRESAHEFDSVIRVARNLMANLSREELSCKSWGCRDQRNSSQETRGSGRLNSCSLGSDLTSGSILPTTLPRKIFKPGSSRARLHLGCTT